MARNKKVEILSNSQEVLHPMTDGDCVIFEDGQTLTQKLSEDDSVKYTPEIVNSSPMFKVGEGNTVDYSDNVLDGAYERATLQGQTYVNYIQESSADEVTLPTPFTEYERTQHNTLTSDEEGVLGINLVGQSYVNALQHDSEEEFVVLGESLEFQEKKVEYTNEGQIKSAMLKGQTLVNLNNVEVKDSSFQSYKDGWQIVTTREKNYNVWQYGDLSLFKPNTKYLVITDVKNNSINTTCDIIVGHNICIFDLAQTLGKTLYQSGEVGKKVSIMTTKSDFTNVECVHRFATNAEEVSAGGIITYRLMIIEYQEGMENWDIPYFEGMQSVTVSTRLENKLGTCTETASIAKEGKTFTTASGEDRTLTLLPSSKASTNPVNLKPNTKYLIYFKISDLVLDGLNEIPLTFSVGTIDAGNCIFVGNKNNENSQVSVSSNGIYKIVRTTTDLINTSALVIKGFSPQWEGSGSTSRSLTISNIMYVEYQNGMENWTLPYFEDYQVMKPVQVETTNRNLFDISKNEKLYFCDMVVHNSSSFTITGTGTAQYKNASFKIDVKPNTDYYIQVSSEVVSGNPNPTFDIYSMNNKYLYGSQATKINSGDNTWLSFRFYVNISNADTGSVKYTVQLEESSTATSFVPHQSKTTYSWDEVILRKIGDVEDTLDLTTGEWIQRIGEIVLDGDENCYLTSIEDTPNWYYTNDVQDSCGVIFRLESNGITKGFAFKETDSHLYSLCDKLPVSTRLDSVLKTVTNVVVCGGNTSIASGLSKCYIALKLQTEKYGNTIAEVKENLKSNPLKIIYVMETPIISKVNLSRPNLQVYDDITHVHTECLDGTLIPNIYLPSDISYPAILEPSTTYNVCVNHTEVSADNPLKVNVGGTEITMTDSRMTLTTPTTLTNSNVSFTGKGNKIKESMLIKNSSLLTGDLPHFNGIGSVQLGKTIENLCSASGFKAGNSSSTITWYDNYVHTNISTTAGSCVFVYELVKPLENDKKYFVYAPHTLTSGYPFYASFRSVYNGALSYAYQQTQIYNNLNTTDTTKMDKCIIEVNQSLNPYTHLCIGHHGTLPLNKEFDVYRPIICEYEPGMEDWDWESIGYFTGTKNIGNEFMRVQNKNLFESNNLVMGGAQYLGNESYFYVQSTNRATMSTLIKVKPSSTLTLKCDSNFDCVIQEYISSLQKTKKYDDGWHTQTHTLTLSDKTQYVNIFFRRTDNGDFTSSDLTTLKNSIQLEESSTATTYAAHKHNGLYITKDQPINLTWEQGQVMTGTNGAGYTNTINNTISTRIRNKGLLNLKPNTTYRLSLGDKASFKYHIACFDNYDCVLSNSITGISTGWVSSTDTIFTTTKDMHKIGINVAKFGDGAITPSESVHVQVRLEEVTDVVLRSCSGKYDELDLTRGTYTQNVGVVYVDGVNQHSHYITVVGDDYQPTDTTLKAFDIRCDGASLNSICLSNRFPMRESNVSTNIDIESVRIHSTNSSCRLTIKKEKASTLEEFKVWLQDNPLEIIYPLSTPIVHKVYIGNKNETNTEVTKPNDVFTLPTLYTEQTHIDLTNNGIIPKVQSRDYIAYPISPMVSRTYTLQHNLTGGVSNLTVDLLGKTQSVSYQNHKSLVYTPVTMDAILHNELRISGKGKISRVMYIDGGYMDRDIPYIEGMKNAVNPIVKNVGKNLYNKDNVYIFNDGVYIGTRDYYKKSTFKVKRNTNYVMTFEQTSSDARIYGFSDETFITYLGANAGGASWVTFNTGICNGISFYRKVKSGLTIDYKITLSEIGTDEPYKENICYVDCGEIRLTPDMFEQGSITVHVNNIGKPYTVALNSDKARIRTKKPINIEPNEQYVIIGNTDKYGYSLHFLDKDENYIGVKTPYELSWGGHKPFTVASDSPKALMFIKRMDNGTITPNDVDVFNFQLVKVSEIKQMRSLPNGVQDEIDLETGKYIQRVGEVVLSEQEEWASSQYTTGSYPTFFLRLSNAKTGMVYSDVVGSAKSQDEVKNQQECSYVGSVSSGVGGSLILRLSASRGVINNDISSLVTYLNSNPITVQYELAEPIVKDIVIHNYPHSYEGGHVIIENGDPNTPIPAQLTYRAVTNRSGQIQQHTEQVEKQDREINELETLILANIHLSQTR